MYIIGKSVYRKEAVDKVTGEAIYTNDIQSPGMLHARMLLSPYAHARIISINTEKAWKIPGVRAILAGERFPLTGEEIRDRPPIAVDKVRYFGETVALVVADNPVQAKRASELIEVVYEPLPVVNSPTEAMQANAPLVHENIESYEKVERVNPEPNTNIANRTKIRKGNIQKGWSESDVTVEGTVSFSPSDHAAMETRCSIAEIRQDGYVVITTSSQAPFMVKKLINLYFGIDTGKVIVNTPLVGGGYGGKAAVQLEILAFLASRAVGGKKVKLFNTREEDLVTSPCHIGLDAKIKLGCTRNGYLKAAEILYLFDGGAYSDKAVDVSRAGAVDCTGPYHIENVWCDSLCIYTNHPYASPFRGFSHSELLFAFERTMDMLAQKLGLDPLELRRKNAILPGHTTPTQVRLNTSNLGNLPACIDRLKEIMKWEEGQRSIQPDGLIRAKGICCIWKTSTIDTDSSSGVILTFNPDGSVNLISGVVEIGTGTKTILAQILSERLKMPIELIHVRMKVNTQTTPEHWKTVASRGTYMAGRAVLEAAEDAVEQIKKVAACVLHGAVSDLEVAGGRVFLKDEPSTGIELKDVVYGYTYPNGNTIGGQVIGRGTYTLRRMTYLDPQTGEGRPGPEWTVGAQGVEVEFNKRDFTYKIIRAVSVIDIGKVINEKAAQGQVMGAMAMGLCFGGRESFVFDEQGRVLNAQFRTYRPLRYGENPEYVVSFVETPQIDAPYGARGVGEHGLIGMPAALGNALSIAAEVNLNQLPLIPELIWRAKKGNQHALI
ncbi:xanthine dehydrogenase family protein molybdopterin-binding subunit [Pseudalkalibacillus caeni]|uniref:Xanthine dehydrogenase family protein molybdopterin-binding subunit n=1 Tax=Exobacillus caeni TaxID=2574798 RepID=A0A5R9EYW0_9BACL|nr:xanthine dehydrogenase family protein molybdopterin-binding subunit [Pseudalkalibacillus caeni]TLS35386.1 xanthine dehydrogenase family protein molybdopterin-binding subunit [Pseudalkalibacillus caeni]